MVVMADFFTKLEGSDTTPDQEATTMTEVFVKHFITKFESQRFIHSDQSTKCELHWTPTLSSVFRKSLDSLSRELKGLWRPESGNEGSHNTSYYT